MFVRSIELTPYYRIVRPSGLYRVITVTPRINDRISVRCEGHVTFLFEDLEPIEVEEDDTPDPNGQRMFGEDILQCVERMNEAAANWVEDWIALWRELPYPYLLRHMR